MVLQGRLFKEPGDKRRKKNAINGVGGHDAPAMDAHSLSGLMNPFDFAAKMWNHAPAMIAALLVLIALGIAARAAFARARA